MPILVQIRPLVQPGRELKEPKKKGDERNLLRQTGCSPRPPTLTQRYVVLHAGWSSGGCLSFKFRQNRVNRFRAVGGRKLPFPIPKASGLYNSLYYRTSRDRHTRTHFPIPIHHSNACGEKSENSRFEISYMVVPSGCAEKKL